MAFADPQSITISGTTTSLPRTGSGIGVGGFASSDNSLVIDVRHAPSRTRTSRTIGITIKKYVSDPLRPADNVPVSATIRLVVNQPVQGFTPADLSAAMIGFINSLTASSNLNITKLLGGEA